MRNRLRATLAAMLVLAACGGSGGGAAETTDASRISTDIPLEAQVHYAGFRLSFTGATQRGGRVTVAATAENLGPISTVPPVNASLDFGAETIEIDLDRSMLPTVPVEDARDVVYAFVVHFALDLSEAVLQVGGAEFARASVPLGAVGTLHTNAPVTGLLTGDLTAGDSVFHFTASELRFDDPARYRPAPANTGYLRLEFTVDNDDSPGPASFGIDNVLLTSPSGVALAPDRVASAEVPPNSSIEGLFATWTIEAVPGTYTFTGRRSTNGATKEAKITFEIPPLG